MTEQVTPTGQWGWSGCGEGTETEGCRAAAEGTQVALGVGGVSEGGGWVFSLRTHCTVLHDNLKHSIMTPFCQFYLSLTFQPLSHTLEAPRSEVLNSLPWAGGMQDSFTKLACLSEYYSDVSVFLHSQSLTQRRSSQTQRHVQSFPQWFMHTPNFGLGETNLSYMHTDTWRLHTEIWTAAFTEVEYKKWLSHLIQVFHQDACLHRDVKVKMHTGCLTNCYHVLIRAHLCVQQCVSKLQRKVCISLSSLQSPFHPLSLLSPLNL